MKIKNKKAVSFLLTLCMLSIPNAGVYADNAGSENHNKLKATDSNALSEDNIVNYENLPEITSIYNTDLTLSEEEIKYGVAMPLGDEVDSEGIDEFDFNEFESDDSYSFDEEFSIDSLIKDQVLYTAGAPVKYINSLELDTESRIPAVYDQETKEKLRKLLMGGSDRVKYFADQMTFGISPIYASTTSTVGHAFDEAIWQNQMILEEDILDIKKDPSVYEDENGNTYYRYDINYQISDPALRKRYQLEMYDKAQSIIDETGMYTNGSYVEELYEINNYIIDHGVYTPDIVRNKVTHTMQRKAYGILVEGKGICSAYARAFQLVARMAGFICVVDGGRAALSKNPVTGAIKTGPHAWNMVYIDEGKWLMVDPTFNDNGGEGFSTPENSYLLIPKNASQRNRISDGRCFAKKGIFTNIEQHSDNFSCDYLNYIGKSAASSDESVDKLCEYINKGFVPRNFRFKWGVSEAELSGISDEIYARTGLKLRISTTGYDAYLATLSKLENHSGKAIRSTDRGLYQIVLKNGIYTESKLRYPDLVYTRGRKATDSNADESFSGSGASGSTSGSTSSVGGAFGASSGSTSSDSTSSGESTSGRTSSGGGASDTGRGSSAKSASPKKNTSLTGSWVQDSKGWWYKNTDNSYPKNEWKEIDAQWYVFNAEGYMITGWYHSNSHWYFLDQSGKLLTGWIETNGNRYYLEPAGKDTKPKGAMYVDEMTEDGYKLGTDGAWIFE
mgnify:FL=1